MDGCGFLSLSIDHPSGNASGFKISKRSLNNIIKQGSIPKELIEFDLQPDGYNIGMNCGEFAGQTVFHFHCHVIPRYKGDLENPRGCVKHVVEGKGYY